jgi:hypothetical protein
MLMYPQQEPMVVDPMSGQYVTLSQALQLYDQMKAQGQNPTGLAAQIEEKLRQLPADAAKSVVDKAKNQALDFAKEKLMPGGLGALAYKNFPETAEMFGITRPEAGISAALGNPSAIPGAAEAAAGVGQSVSGALATAPEANGGRSSARTGWIKRRWTILARSSWHGSWRSRWLRLGWLWNVRCVQEG